MNYPIIYFDVKEDGNTGMSTMAFVDNPATQIEWQMFSREEAFARNDMKRIVTGPVMLAETPIPRFDKSIGKFYCKFTAESIFNMQKKYHMQNLQNNVNEAHLKYEVVDGVFMIESYIITEDLKHSKFKIPKGSWMASYFIEDEKYWNEKILTGEFKGLSLEGKFDVVEEEELLKAKYEIAKAIYYDEKKSSLDKWNELKGLL